MTKTKSALPHQTAIANIRPGCKLPDGTWVGDRLHLKWGVFTGKTTAMALLAGSLVKEGGWEVHLTSATSYQLTQLFLPEVEPLVKNSMNVVSPKHVVLPARAVWDNDLKKHTYPYYGRVLLVDEAYDDEYLKGLINSGGFDLVVLAVSDETYMPDGFFEDWAVHRVSSTAVTELGEDGLANQEFIDRMLSEDYFKWAPRFGISV